MFQSSPKSFPSHLTICAVFVATPRHTCALLDADTVYECMLSASMSSIAWKNKPHPVDILDGNSGIAT